MMDQFRVVGYYDPESDESYCNECRPTRWREMLALLPADIPAVDQSDEPPVCATCGHYL